MASQGDIDAVKVQVIDEADSFGITDSVITAWLDSGLSVTKSILATWRAIAAKTAMVEDVSESGSSRNSRIHDNARAMVEIWQARADAEDKATLTDDLGRKRWASHTATRV